MKTEAFVDRIPSSCSLVSDPRYVPLGPRGHDDDRLIDLRLPRHSPMTEVKVVPPIPLNCPSCGEKLTHVWTSDRIEVYHCPNDGVVVVPPDGPIRVVVH